MNDSEKQLINYLCHDNYRMAKLCAEQLMIKNKVKKDEVFCQQMLTKLKKDKEIEIPANIAQYLVVENPQTSFFPGRYYVSEREENLYKKISCMKTAAEKLKEIKVHYLNTVLLYGESGTGKTSYGRYLAYRLNLPFIYVNFSYLIDSLLGRTSANIARVFDFVKSHACVFMLDELDVIGGNRINNDLGEMGRVTVGVMQCMDALPNDIVLVAATNIIEKIDPALRRRFSLEHEVSRLDEAERILMAKNFFQDVCFPIKDEQIKTMVGDDITQSELMNRMTRTLAEYYANRIEP